MDQPLYKSVLYHTIFLIQRFLIQIKGKIFLVFQKTVINVILKFRNILFNISTIFKEHYRKETYHVSYVGQNIP